MKRHTTLSVDEELMKDAKERGINISGELDTALRERLGKVDAEIDNKIKNCEFCGKPEVKAFCDNHGKYHDGMTWLYPDEKWICKSCLWHRSRHPTSTAKSVVYKGKNVSIVPKATERTLKTRKFKDESTKSNAY